MQQPRRREKTAGVQKDLVAEVVGGDDDRVGKGVGCTSSADRLTRPGTWGDDLHSAGDVGKGDHHQAVARPGVLMQAGAFIWGEDNS